MAEIFRCAMPGCTFKADADRMWNTDARQAEDGQRRILCGKHAHEARKGHGIRCFRLAETLKRDAEREAQHLAANAFFQAFAKAGEAKATPASARS